MFVFHFTIFLFSTKMRKIHHPLLILFSTLKSRKQIGERSLCDVTNISIRASRGSLAGSFFAGRCKHRAKYHVPLQIPTLEV